MAIATQSGLFASQSGLSGSQAGLFERKPAAHRVLRLLTLLSAALFGVALLRAQSLPPLPSPPKPSLAGSDAASTTVNQPTLARMPLVPGTEMDRVVAIVNNDLILDSDVDQERRLAALLPYGEGAGQYSRDAAIQRLINRDLILEQVKLQPSEEITQAAAAKDLDSLRKDISACREYNCETNAGWNRFLASQGFTEASVTKLWQERMEVLAFIEQRFRMGVRISPAQIKAYYDNELRAQYAAQHATPPPLATISTRIQQVLLERQVSGLLDDWLNSLRAQGSVVVLHPGEEAP